MHSTADTPTQVNGYLTPEDIFARTAELLDARTGLVNPPMELPADSGSAQIIVYSSALSRLQNALPHIELRADDGLIMSGSGSSVRRGPARAKAVCEALERYCNISYDPAAIRVATRNELGDAALDLSLFHRGQDSEYKAVSSHIRASDELKMRWVKGSSLVTGRELWVPFSAIYIATPYKYPGEAFVIPISTGSGLAASYARAAVAGTLELVERDTLSLVWLQKMRLKRIDISASRNVELVERARMIAQSGIEQFFFDATTDIGFPTAYLIQRAPGRSLHILVMAATRLNMEDAIIRVMDEASSSRIALESLARQPKLYRAEDFRSFTRLTDGAVFYGDPANEHAFDFLLRDHQTVALEDIGSQRVAKDTEMMDEVVAAFRRSELELICVDLTTPQLKRIGLRSVRMLAPQLMPLTINYNMKYGATPRLYQAPQRMGLEVHGFDALNPWPQPFA